MVATTIAENPTAQGQAHLERPPKIVWNDNGHAPGILLPGSGMHLWWQLGAVARLAKMFDLSQAQFAGASVGALAAVLAACDIDINRALDVAWRLCDEAGVFGVGALGFYGVWGRILHSLLHELLPSDAHVRCNGRVNILLRRPFRPRKLVNIFSSRSDLIDACLASAHIPWVMDKHFSAQWRGFQYVDSSFGSEGGLPKLALPQVAPSMELSPNQDFRIRDKSLKVGSTMKKTSKRCMQEMMRWGETYVLEIDKMGMLEPLEGIRRRR